MMKKAWLVISLFILNGCLGMPKGVTPIDDFDLNRYLGQWYEIARLDHSFERGLERVTAEYQLKDDGGVSVLNRGYSTEDQKWKEAEGKAYFVDSPSKGYLKVSFFGPFYGSYIVFELEQGNYDYAFISGPSNEYAWLLSRTPTVSDGVIELFMNRLDALGFDKEEVILVNHQ